MDVQAEFEAEQEKLKQLSYLSAAEQKKFADRQSIAFMYMKPPGYDAGQKRQEQVSNHLRRPAQLCNMRCSKRLIAISRLHSHLHSALAALST